jgi:hypothetical protein
VPASASAATSSSTSTSTNAPATGSASTTPVLSVFDLPRAGVSTAPARHVVRHVVRAAQPTNEAQAPVTAAATSAPEPVAQPAAPPPKPVAQPAPPPPKPVAAPAAPAPAPGSLEDLIRREVAAEQKRLHAGGK